MLEEHVKGLALGSVVLDDDARALDDLAGVALGIDLAETGPLAELHLVVNLCGGGTRNGHSTKRGRVRKKKKTEVARPSGMRYGPTLQKARGRLDKDPRHFGNPIPNPCPNQRSRGEVFASDIQGRIRADIARAA